MDHDPDDLNHMRWIVEHYEDLQEDDPYLASEFLEQLGSTRDVVLRYKRLIAAAEKKKQTSSPEPSPTSRARRSARRDRGRPRSSGRRSAVAPPGHPGIRRTPVRRRGRRIVITIRIVIDLP
ncbi:hypothetical protein ACIQM4_18010 [Streptomyces sp. NPDC091272]|uniref:hypothetical protein n=1 Tax=Streptomyces sp. NPDC091272 TaxID=3365981 RepID=UPI00381D5124